MRPTPTYNGLIYRCRAGLLLLAMALPFSLSLQAQDFVLEVIPLQHRPALELLPLLQPFIAEGGVLKAADSKLVVRTTPANLSELRTLIGEFDRPLQQLLITVQQLSGDAARDRGAELQGQIGNETRVGARVWQTERRNDADRVQQVLALDGGQVFIDVGRQIPVNDLSVTQSRSSTRVEQQTRYVGASSGFYARPRVNGDTVTVEIIPYQTTASGSATPPAFDTQSLHTTVSGRLGEWIEIGASTTTTDEKGSKAIVSSSSRRGEQDRRILLRVTVAP